MLTTSVSGRTWSFSHSLGAFTTEGKGFLHPMDVAVAPGGILYVVSRGQFATMDSQISKDRLRITKLTIEEEFISAIRGLERVTHTNFEDGVRYMEFTEAVVRAAQSGETVYLPL